MPQLLSEQFAADPRVKQARKLMLDALSDHQRNVTGVRPPDSARAATYEQTLRAFSDLRGGALYYPYLGSGFGRGPLVELADGSVKYDMISGIGVHYFGHNHPALVGSGIDAALQDTVMQGNLQQNAESVEISRLLLDAARTKDQCRLSHCFLSSSGAMANENALKMVLQKRSPASRLLAFSHAFAGRTLAMAQITDKAAYREGLPTVLPIDYVPFFDAAHPKESTERAIAVLKEHLHRFPHQHAAMCMELIQGEGGYHAGNRGFFLALIELLKANNIAVWVDEIQTFGRTENPFAFQTFGLDEHVDMATVGKLTQVCSTLFTEDFKPRPGLISQTFTAATSAMFAGLTILKELLDGGYFGADGKISRVRNHFVARLEKIAAAHPTWVRGPYGAGVMIAFTPFDGTDAKAKTLLQALYRAGVIAFVAGAEPARIRFLPPVAAIENADIDAVCGILEQTLAEVSACS